MKLNLERPICFFDLEATGLDREIDRIVEISICKLFPDLSREYLTSRINPLVPIPKEASEIHGIFDDDVKDCPTFEDLGQSIYEFILGCDIAGFNSNNFDIPMLYFHLLRIGIKWDYKSIRKIDVGNIFKINEPRTLSAAAKFYLGTDLDDAHSAEADVNATVDVFMAQLEKYDNIPMDLGELELFTNYGKPILDVSGKFTTDEDGDIVINFGQYKGRKAKNHLDYIQWMLYKANFNSDTNDICSQLLDVNNPF